MKVWKKVKIVHLTVLLGEVRSFTVLADPNDAVNPCQDPVKYHCEYDGIDAESIKILTDLLDALKAGYPSDATDGVNIRC